MCCLAVCVALAWPVAAPAQDATDAARRALIADAATASRRGDHARAIELATRAATIRATPSLRYFLAREHLAVGRLVEALSLAGECAAGARADREVHNRAALVARCEAVAAQADRGVARLTVRVPPAAPDDLRVAVAGAPLPAALYDVAVPVAPGSIEVTATAAGRAPFRASVTLDAGASGALTVALVDAPPAPGPPSPSAAPSATPAPAPAPPPTVSLRAPAAPSAGAGPWVVAGVGAVGLAVGGALGALALVARADRVAACPSTTSCDVDTATRLDARYRDEALGANVALGLGAASVVAAATWWIVARVAQRPVHRIALVPGGVTLRW